MMAWWLGAIASAATLSGRVVDEATGVPLSGVTIEAYDLRLRGFGMTVSDDGRFAMPLETAGPWRVRAVPRWDDPHTWQMVDGGGDFCSSTPVWLDTDVDLGDIALGLGAEVRGTIVDSAGAPVLAATVWAQSTIGSQNYDRPAITNERGEFVIVGIDTESGGPTWTIATVADGWPDQYRGNTYDDEASEPLTLSGTESQDIGTMTLLDGIIVGGAVIGPDGPVSEGTVLAYANGQIQSVDIDETGRYEAIGLPTGDVITWVSAPGYAQTYLPDADRPTTFVPVTEEGAVREDLDLYPPLEATLDVRFVNADGETIEGIGGLLYNDTRTVGLGNSADGDGILRIDGLYGGHWLLYVWGADQGYVDDWIRDASGVEELLWIEPETATSLTLTLPAAARLAGRVIDEDGQSVDGIAVAAIRSDGSGQGETSNREGEFTIGGLAEGEYTFSAEYAPICPGDPGYVPVWWPGTPNPDWAQPLVVTEGEQRTALVLQVARDVDLDEMADSWEREHGLDPSRAEDAWEDPDNDSYVNLDEYRMGTDPHDGTPKVALCGCASPSPLWLYGWPCVAWFTRRRRRP